MRDTGTPVLNDIGFSEAELRALAAQIDHLDPDEAEEVEKLLEELEMRLARERARDDLIDFCQYMDPKYLVGRHHRILADQLMGLEGGDKDRVTVNMPPRHGKSELVSKYFPAWFIGRNPTKKIMMVSHTSDLAVDFGRKVRNLIADERFQEIFPDIILSADSKSAGRWDTNKGGTYYATGVGSSLAGRGADMLIIDDPHSEQDILNGNFEIFDKAYQWFTFGARTRLMPGGRVAVVATRWHLDDLCGRLIRDMAQNEHADQYEVVEFPAILEVKQPDDTIVEKPLWPEFFDLEALHRTRASMPVFQWNAQYQQNPTAESAALVKREWWRIWKPEEPPEVEYIIMALDTASEEKQRADYTALTVWGVFFNDEEHMNQLILLEAIRRRVEFPELKILTQEQYRRWEPDAFIVEKKNSGVALYQELRRTGMLVQEYTPHRGSGNKYARLQSVADIISSGAVWVPETRWAEELVEEIASFPVGSHDDLVDSSVIALMRFRQGGFLTLKSDNEFDNTGDYMPYRAAYY
jgi:predicted phage terminase large subunit-like protein